jgi:RHS repeat-associated protein
MLVIRSAVRSAARCFVLFALVGGWAGAQANQLPRFDSVAGGVAEVGREYAYHASATDPDGDALQYELAEPPAGAQFDAQSGSLVWTPDADQIGSHSMTMRAIDSNGAIAEQRFTIRVTEGFCAIYPIALPLQTLATLPVGAHVDQMPRGTGAGNFSWLSWTGAVDAPTLAQSLQPPGDSDTYANPADTTDRRLDTGDWAQGATGSMNAHAVRERLDALLQQDITLPVWDDVRGQGSQFDYRIVRFVVVRLTGYQLTGQGWLSFDYRGEAQCYNRLPTAQAQLLQTAEDTPLALQLLAQDADNDALTYELLTSPMHGAISGGGAQRNYVPEADFHGDDSFEFRVSDGQEWSSPATVSIVVTPVNDAPHARDADYITDEDVALAFELQGSDIDSPALEMRVSTLPAHGTVEGAAPHLIYVPGAGFHGEDSLSFVVYDGAIDSVPANVRITVRSINDAPQITSLPPLAVEIGKSYAYAAAAIDPDTDDILTWSLLEAPAGMTINPGSGQVAWTPSSSQVGTHAVVVQVADSAGATDSQRYDLPVQRENAGPQIVSTPPLLATEGEIYQYEVQAHDPDGDALTYSFNRAPAQMTIDAAGGNVAWTAPASLSRGLVDANPYCRRPVQDGGTEARTVDLITVVDRSGSMSTEHEWIPSLIPTIELNLRLNGVGAAGDDRYGLVDFDNFPRSIPVDGNPFGDFNALARAAMNLRPDGPTGNEDGYQAIHFALANYTFREQAARNVILITDEGRYPVDPSLTSASMLAELRQHHVLLNAVLNVELRCADNRPALGVAASGEGFVADGQGGYSICASARVHTGYGNTGGTYAPLALQSGGAVWDLNQLRAGGHLAESLGRALIDVKVREIAGQTQYEPRADLVPITIGFVEATEQSAAQAQVTVLNRGLGASAPRDINLAVSSAVAIHEVASQTLPILPVGAEHTLTFELDTGLDDAHALIATIEPDGSSDCEPANDRLQSPLVQVRATDPFGLFDAQRYALTVTERNQAPAFEPMTAPTLPVGQVWTHVMQAADADLGDALSYRLTQAPLGMSVDTQAGELRFKPVTSQIGQHPVRVVARDLHGLEAERSFTLMVTADNPPPSISGTPQRRAVQGSVWTFTPAIENAAGATITLFGGPAGMTIDPLTGALTWSVPTDLPAGTLTYVVWAVVRSDGAYDTQVFDLFVDSPNSAPTITSSPGLQTLILGGYGYTPTAVDSNFREVLDWSLLDGPATTTIDQATGQLDWSYVHTAADFPETHDAFDFYCREPVSTGVSLAPRQAWAWGGVTYPGQPVVVHVIDSNADGSVDADDAPSIAVVGTLAATGGARTGLAMLDAATGALQWKFTSRILAENVAPAAADIDGDGRMELLAATSDQRIVALDGAGTERWVSPVVSGPSLNDAAIAAADLDADGVMEVLIGGDVFAGDGTLRWRFETKPLAPVQNLGNALALDTQGDARPELIFMDQVRDTNGALLRRLTLPARTQYVRWSAGNLDTDAALELVAIAKIDNGASVLAFDTDGTPLFGAKPIPMPGHSVIADFDADGATEILVTGMDRYFEADGTSSASLFDNPGGYPGFAADLDRDGTIELVRGSANHLYFLAGATGGRIYFGAGLGGGAASPGQGPVLGRVNAEGWLFTTTANSVVALRAATGLWAPPHVNPTQQQPQPIKNAIAGAPPAGTFNTVTALGTASTPLADLWIGNIKVIETASGADIELEVRNRGLIATAAPVALRVHAGVEASGGALLHESMVAPLGAGQSRLVRFAVEEISALRDQLYAQIDPQQAIDECETRNNRNSARYLRLRTTDHGGLSDTQHFAVQVRAPNTIPTFASAPKLTATEFAEYFYDVQITDPDVGDRQQFGFTTAPAGASIDRVSGEIRWTPARGQAGTHRFMVSVTDLESQPRYQVFDVVVGAAPNTAPQIVSAPIERARTGGSYRYAVLAQDAQGDPLSYALDAAPTGMTVVSTTGVISWTPTAIGQYPVSIAVSDNHGARTTQSFTLEVTENHAPAISSAPRLFARVGVAYSYAVLANDADGDALAYTLLAGQQALTMSATGSIAWTPSTEPLGPHAVRVKVSDGTASVEQSWTIELAAADAPPQLSIRIDPATPTPTQPIELFVSAELAGTIVTTLDGNPIALDAGGHATLQPQAAGPHALIASLENQSPPAIRTLDFVVADPAGAAPQVSLLTPLPHPDYDSTEITAPALVTGSVLDIDLTRWELGFQDLNGGPIIELASGTSSFEASDIATFDPTRLLNGQYQLVLQAWDAAGHRAIDVRVLRVTGDLKLGHYSITFEEVSIPVAGIPVAVTRTYDTRRRMDSLDFGYGWTVDANNVRVHESRRLGFGWQMHRIEQGALDKYCLLPNGDPIVTVTLPDGQVESFRARAEPECGVTPRVDVTVLFEPIDGTDSKLASHSYGTVRFSGSNLIDLSDPQLRPIDPGGYMLTTAEGVIYQIDQATGLQKVSEPNGKWLTYTRDGVHHSSGVGIDFVRDGQGRITQMQLPDGNSIDYSYSPAGDLIGLTDAGDDTAGFGYHARFAHYLETIVDARGITVSRNEYDDAGKLVATIDAQGHRLEYAHDIAGRTAQVKDRRGHVTHYVYNDRGDVLAETNALQETVFHTYDDDGNELSRTDALDRVTTWTYDVRGNVLSETNAANETTSSTWNAQNQLLTQRDAADRLVLQNEYIDHGLNLFRSVDALGHATTFRYDFGAGSSNTGNLDILTDAAGASTGWRYSAVSTFKMSETDALGHVTHFEHDELGRVTQESRTRTRADGTTQTLVTGYVYDAKGRVTSTTHPDGSVTTAEYDGLDQPVKECDAIERCTEHDYDERGQEVETRYADGTAEHKTYDANGNLLTQTDRGGRTTTFVYDAADRLIETIHPDDTPADDSDNPRTANVYDDAGQLVESIDENGRATRYVYDDAGRRTQVIQPDPATGHAGAGAVTITHYDDAGRRTAMTDASGNTTRFVYDDAGRLLETVHPDAESDDGDDSNNPRTRTEYDALGRKTADLDDAGRITRYAYDKLSRLVAVVLPDPATGSNPPLVNGASPDSATLTTRYAYDEVGNKIEQIDAEGRVTRWEYDAMGRETARVLPEGQRETKTYNAAGELKTYTDFNGATTGYDYDAVGRVDRIDYPQDADLDPTYNAAGERTQIVDGRGTSTAQHDARGRVVQVHDADGGLIEYEYDAAGNLLARISPSQSMAYDYDATNRLIQVTRSVDGEPPTVTRYEYDAVGNRAAMIGGDGIRTEYGYDRRHRLRELVKKTEAGTLLLSMSYTVDATGMRTVVEEADPAGIVRTVAYQYDAVKRLTRETIDHREASHDRSSDWTYDRVGNRLTQALTTAAGNENTSYAYDDNDRLLTETNTTSGLTTYTYDDNGNTRSKSTASGLTTYSYDDANHLVAATTPDGTTTYVYNADGLRVRQTHTQASGTATTTWYVQDSAYPYAQVIEEYVSAGVDSKRLAATFTFADDLVSQTRYDAQGNPSTHFVQQDGFGSTRRLTDSSGAITDSIDYDAFGNEIARSGSVEIEHLYRGERFDTNVEFYDLRARLYNSANGRFFTQDGFPGLVRNPRSLNKYVYADADPTNGRDPSGYMTMMDLGAGLNLPTIGRTISAQSVRTFVKRVVTRAIRSVGNVRSEVRKCLKSMKSCDLDVPVLVVGGSHGEMADHIFDAQTGNGSNYLPAGFLHSYNSRAHSRWYIGSGNCTAGDLVAAISKYGPAVDCDEFPKNSMDLGGAGNYPSFVSLRYVPGGQNKAIGAMWMQLVNSSGMKKDKNKKALVVAWREIPISVWLPVR